MTFFIGKGDWQISPGQAFTVRLNTFKNNNPYNMGGGGNTAVERSVDYTDKMFSIGGQLVSTLGPTRLNEMRVQWAQRHNNRVPSADAATGPAVNISGSISFGAPVDSGTEFQQDIYQFIDNFTLMRGNHSYKAGIDYQYVKDFRGVNETPVYTFATIAAYNAALAGTSPFGYSTFAQTVGVPTLSFNDSLFSAFVQDDWRLSSSFKMVYGARYDLYLYPDGVPNATYALQQHFNIDKNNIAPRARLRVDDRPRPEDRAAREHRHHVRPAAARDRRAELHAEQQPVAPHSQFERHGQRERRQSGRPAISGLAQQPAAGLLDSAVVADDLRGGSELRDRPDVPEQHPAAARHRPRLLRGDRLHLQPRLQPADRARQQPARRPARSSPTAATSSARR